MRSRRADGGQPYGLDYAEPFHYVSRKSMPVDDYVEKNAVGQPAKRG